MISNLNDYAVLGLARSGVAAAHKIKELGGSPYLSDSQPVDKIPYALDLIKEFDCEFGGHSDKLFSFGTWIVSPGIPLDTPIIQKARERSIKLISELEFGFQIKSHDSKVIAVTGSNGKSTTVSLIHHVLRNIGYNSILAGNIGSAMCSHPIQLPGIDFLVLEVSSFQLDLIHSFKPDTAVLLNITPDHMNRYASFDAYVASKFRIFENQAAQQTAVVCLDSEPITTNLGSIKSHLKTYSTSVRMPETSAWFDGSIIHFGPRYKLPADSLALKGTHNFSNTMAALLAVDSQTGELELSLGAAQTFKPLEHRLEYVATINGVLFYNDSKATNTDSVKCALTSYEKPIRIIMGGSDKGEDFSVLTELLKKWAKKVYVTGDTASAMKNMWSEHVDLCVVEDFARVVEQAFLESQAGDIIVLSPACASFDKFRNYEHRGEVFKRIVQDIAGKNETK